MKFFRASFKKYQTLNKGFTLIEFIVIMIIFSIMASVALFNFQGFRNNISLTNLAHDLALTIRQAQVFGISASDSISIGGSQSRGIYFEYDDTENEFIKTFTLFSDVIRDGKYDENDDAIVDQITINSNDSIARIEDSSGNDIPRDVHITFTRPDPDAYITDAVNVYDHIMIYIIAEDGREKTVEVFRNGQIRVSE
jgi:prepilin-type N-terminal cleavage/methylation domain-containing protein